MPGSELPIEALYTACKPEEFDFETTAGLRLLESVIGQDRAVESIEFAIGVRRPGYNIFAFGPPGTGKSTTLDLVLGRVARDRPEPDDWCYVYDFAVAHRPRALRLPPGWGTSLRNDMVQALADLVVVLPQVFESEAYAMRRESEAETFETQTRETFEALDKRAAERDLMLLQSPEGMAVVPSVEGKPMDRETFSALPEERQAELRKRMSTTEEELAQALREVRGIQRAAREALSGLQRRVATEEVDERLAPLRERYGSLEHVVGWLGAVAEDILDNLDRFLPTADGEDGQRQRMPTPENAEHIVIENPRLRRYRVNVVIDGSNQEGAPVVVERYPTLPNLVGRIEQEQRLGALMTDFTLIKPGALHAANGGYLVLEMDEVLQHPLSWEALKRALKVGAIHIEPPAEGVSTMTTITLDPEPIALDCKIVLIGDARTYYMLQHLDPDFPELFKVGAEFGRSMPRYPAGCTRYSRFIATAVNRCGARPFDRAAVARIVEHGARLAEDSQRLTTDFLSISDLVTEADYWASSAGREVVGLRDVNEAIERAVRRADLARERSLEGYARNIVQLQLDGTAVGQVNALTVVARGDFEFGLPVRVSARVRQGSGEVVDIEREVELGGPLHSKGVLILSGYLNGRYLPEDTLAIQASLTFEQSYGPVDGDSASSTELYALISALSGLPVRQDLAVTGSLSQSGQVQAIGGVNEKIEGFFDVCRQKGLTGSQGVMIPHSNIEHLMLRHDVRAAVRAGEFHVYAVEHVDQGLELLTGKPAGERSASGEFPEGTVHRAAEDRLRLLAEKRREQEDSAAGRSRRRPRRPSPPIDNGGDDGEGDGDEAGGHEAMR